MIQSLAGQLEELTRPSDITVNYPLEISQASASEELDHIVAINYEVNQSQCQHSTLVNIQNDGSGACSFLCVNIAHILSKLSKQGTLQW